MHEAIEMPQGMLGPTGPEVVTRAPKHKAEAMQESARWLLEECPDWCETDDHVLGDPEHRMDRYVVCSLHPRAHPTIEAVRSGNGHGHEQWFQQNQAMNIGLVFPPGAAEPYIEVNGHDVINGAHPATRLSLAEGALLARTLRELIAASFQPGW